MGLSSLIPMKIVICCKEKCKQEVKIRSIRAVFGLYLVPGKCQISVVSGGFAPCTPPGCCPGPTWGLAAPPDPPTGLGNDELFNQVPSYGF